MDEVLHVYCAKQILSRYVRTQTFAKSLNREVRHSQTWHSSESESALERFEPIAAAKQLLDGRGTLFAPVAARRQKVLKEEFLPLFVLFVLFGQAKRTL